MSEPQPQASQAITQRADPASGDLNLLLMRLDARWPDTRIQRTAPNPSSHSPFRLGKYTLMRELGRGGFGVVYLADDPETGREVALKIPRPELLTSGPIRERFLRESAVMARLEHPNVVRVFEVGEADGIDFIASEYCSHGSLADALLQRQEPLPPHEATSLVRQLADAVAYIHVEGLWHRDLKPSNVLLAPTTAGDDSSPLKPLLTDFGLARLVERSLEETGSSVIMGTPLYMAPEQAVCRHDLLGPWTDVYSLGAILYELLTGLPPYPGASLLVVLDALRVNEPRSFRSLGIPAGKELEAICLKCMAKSPRDRYQTAGELRDDLLRFERGERVSARLPGTVDKLKKWLHQEQRLRDAGLAMMFINGAISLWLLFGAAFILLAPGIAFDRLLATVDIVILAIIFTLPMTAIGYQTFVGRTWAVWAGLSLVVANSLMSFAGLTGLYIPFSGLYHDGNWDMRVLIFGIHSSLLLVETVLYVFAAISVSSRSSNDVLELPPMIHATHIGRRDPRSPSH